MEWRRCGATASKTKAAARSAVHRGNSLGLQGKRHKRHELRVDLCCAYLGSARPTSHFASPIRPSDDKVKPRDFVGVDCPAPHRLQLR